MLHERPGVSARVLAHLRSGAAECPLLAPSWPCPVERSSQDAHRAPPSPETPLPRRLPRLSPRLSSLIGGRVRAYACASLARGEKPARCPQACEHQGLRLSQPEVPLLRQNR